ncbi:MAG: D-alanyl-D-alanine carboxypeptidase [Clostridia bacterium]|nr:D-alanyl-D-alanine carboxypeptidase [Clostridia bacterium]
MSDRNDNRNTDNDGWVFPDKRPPRRPADAPPRQNSAQRQNPAPRQAQQRGESASPRGGQYPPRRQSGAVATAERERQAPRRPERSGNVPPAGMYGARRTPEPFGSRYPSRSGIRTREATPEKKKSHASLVLILLAIAAIAIILLIVIPKNASSTVPVETDTEEVTETETEAETEPEPEVPAKYSYCKRTESTVQLGNEIECEHAILIDLENRTVIAEKGGDDRMYPASMTKVMTALAAIEKCSDLNNTFMMTYDIVMDAYNANATVAGFYSGEELTIKDLLYGSILPSGADGTRGLAEYTSGTETAFAQVMNEKCAELGLTGTHFSNSSGLHADDHYSTCHDMAIIMEAAMDDPDVAAALGAAEYVTSKTNAHPDGIELHHTLLFERMDGSEEFDGKIQIIGGKTGYTPEAGNCLVTAAKVVETGKVYIFVCGGGETKWKPVFDTIHVYRNYLGVQYEGEYVSKSQR